MIGKLYIGGKWIETEKKFPIYNPYDRSLIGEFSYATESETKEAIRAATLAGYFAHNTGAQERSSLLKQLHRLLTEHKEEMAHLITQEQGKALKESEDEVQYALSYLEWFAEEAKRIYGDVSPYVAHHQMQYSIYQPIGVVGIITPWNFPLAVLARKLGPCIATGCTAVIKPSEFTPFIAERFMQLVDKSDVAKGWINMVVGDYKAIGQEISTSESVKMITFTGSPKVGKLMAEQAAKQVKRVLLELGGNAPFIVFEDADVDAAVDGLIASKIRNGGQSCVCANRIFVHNKIMDEFTRRLISKLAMIKIGNGFNRTNNIGPVINQFAVERIKRLCDDAKEKGAITLYSSPNCEDAHNSCLVNLEVLEVTSRDTEMEKVEIFGPIIALYRFDSEEEVISRANDSHHGLAAFVYSRDNGRIIRTTQALEYGMVAVNSVTISSAQTSFGGIKESGLGREGGKKGMFEFLQEKFVSISY